MSKIQKISITNFKAIKGKVEADFKGCTAIITAGNDKGKTSFIQGIPNRIRFIRPEIIVNDTEETGKGEMELTTGEKFIWEYDVKGKDKLTYITDKGIKQGVTKDFGEKFFPPVFDIDKFLQSPPKSQVKQLQQILNVDFIDVDARYEKAYSERTSKNADSEKFHVKLSQMLKVSHVGFVDLTELQKQKEQVREKLNKKYQENKNENAGLRFGWNERCSEIRKKNEALELARVKNHNRILKATELNQELISIGYNYNPNYVEGWIENFPKAEKIIIQEPKEPEYINEMPDDSELQKIDAEILTASQTNVEAQKYLDYINYKKQTEEAKVFADEIDALVKSIEQERLKMIEAANFPLGISMNSFGITIDGLPLDKSQISLSKLYITALRIAAMNIGEVRTLYFEASPLDRANLEQIEKWAAENDLQLLIERPAFDGGEIQYEIVETKC